MKNLEKRKEARAAYIMILPAVLIIAAVALWPVLNSFWNSLFDLRLNHPTKNSVVLDYQIDLERFVDAQYYINGAFRQIRASDELNRESGRLDAIQGRLHTLKDNLIGLEGMKTQYEEVEKLFDQMKPVNDPELRYARVEKDYAIKYLEEVEAIQGEILSLSLAEDDAAEQAAELTGELGTCILKPNYIGFDNYKHFLQELTIKDGEPGRLAKSLLNTVTITFSSVFLELVLGLMVALVINRQFRGRGLTRAFVLVPWAIPTVVSARMWAFLYDGQTGIIAHWLDELGLIGNSGVLLTTKFGALCSVVFADVWKTTPYMALLLLAGLQSLSRDIYESASIDGATRVQQFFRITLPLLKPTILVALLFRTLDAFRIFDLIYVLTGGGPGNATESISIYAYVTMFSQMDFGKGSTLSIIVFLCISLISIAYIKLLGADVMSNQVRDRG